MRNNINFTKHVRKGVVLLAVLIVLVILSLIAYNYSDFVLEEYKGSDNFHKAAQARAFADSGVHYALAVMSNPDAISGVLNNNPYDNPRMFRGRPVSVGGVDGYFSLVAPLSGANAGGSGCQYGVVNEDGKININALMVADPTGKQLYNMLILLPNMTDEIANSIIDWVDADSTPLPGGAESDYYMAQARPYACKNGPLDSLDELLLVKGVTTRLLYGADDNRNGYQDPGEENANPTASGGFDLGWSAFLTVKSREQNYDPAGATLTNLNDSSIDVLTMYDLLAAKLGDDLAKFIIMCRQLGSTAPTASSTTSVTGAVVQALRGTTSANSSTQTGVLANYQIDTTKAASKQIKSLFDLVSNTVQVKTTMTTTTGKKTTSKTVTTIYNSPLADPAQQATLLPLLFQTATVFTATEIPARINVNTAPAEVLAALPGLTSADVQAIQAFQPQYSSPELPLETYQTPAWLITQANVSPTKLSKLEPYITTRSQVYRVQSLGYFDQNKGPVFRIEAIIDANLVSIPNGAVSYQPRILYWRDMGDFGRMRPPQ